MKKYRHGPAMGLTLLLLLLSSWGCASHSQQVVPDAPLNALDNMIDVRLDGATEYELTEVFGKVINTATGVVAARRYSAKLVPDNPQASHVTWRVRLQDTDPFRFQTNVMNMINQILDAGGEINLRGVPYRYSAAEVNLLMGIRPGDATSRSIQFVIDRERARDREFERRHDPYKAREIPRSRPSSGFE